MRERDVTGLRLMDRAAQAVCDALLEMTSGGAVFLCGPGNNGGDGYAAARMVAAKGREAWIWSLSDPEALRGDARTNWQLCLALGIPVVRMLTIPDAPPPGAGVVVDAMFGTGLDRPLSGLYARAAEWMAGCGLPVLAVDMPSGTGAQMVRATRTVTFHMRKTNHLLFPGRINAGTISVAPIGIPDDPPEDAYALLEDADLDALLPPRPLDAHKGSAGRVVLLCGSRGMAGAAALCANAALRGGAGLAQVACAEAALDAVQALAPCATCVPRDRLSEAVRGASAIGAGPGLGMDDETAALLFILRSVCLPQVWDADALNWLASSPETLGERFVITPHPGEAGRLLGVPTNEITSAPLEATRALSEKYRCTALLKGATTVIHSADGRAMNVRGSQGMATGGSGDVLTGLIAALLSQGLSSFNAARVGAFLHGRAGEEAARRHGIRSMTAWDLLNTLRVD